MSTLRARLTMAALAAVLAAPPAFGDQESREPASEANAAPRHRRRGGRAGRNDPRVRITLDPGVTLVDIARTYEIPVSRIIAANGIREPRFLHAGRKLVIPGATRRRPLQRRPVCRNPAVEFLRIANSEAAHVVLTRCNGEADPAGVVHLSHLVRSLRANAELTLHPRLLEMLQRVASHFPARRLEVISGYRPHPQGRIGISNHTRGRAIDFRVAGIANETLRDYCRQFDDAGVGYYPNSVFVHLDVRDRHAGKAFWVDYSRPGEAPRYGPLGGPTADRSAPRGHDRRL